jgi:hypothetical protein
LRQDGTQDSIPSISLSDKTIRLSPGWKKLTEPNLILSFICDAGRNLITYVPSLDSLISSAAWVFRNEEQDASRCA